jgi:hypothetical protein
MDHSSEPANAGPMTARREHALAQTTTLRPSAERCRGMRKVDAPLERALRKRWRGRIGDEVAGFGPCHIESGRFGKPTCRDRRFLTLRDHGLCGAGSLPEAIGRVESRNLLAQASYAIVLVRFPSPLRRAANHLSRAATLLHATMNRAKDRDGFLQ